MALEASMRVAALRVAAALHRFAEKRGWPPENYRIFMTVNPDWGHLHVIFVSNEFGHDDEHLNQNDYDDVMDSLEEDFKEVPELYRAIGMVLIRFDALPFYAPSRLGGSDVEVDPLLLNPGLADLETVYRP